MKHPNLDSSSTHPARQNERGAGTMRYLSETSLGRWGRVVRPVDDAGAYLALEEETRAAGYPPPPVGAIRLRHRRPGVAEDDDANWTVWFEASQLAEWLGPSGHYEVEWLPEGVEPDW
jgi:hypothetical protein